MPTLLVPDPSRVAPARLRLATTLLAFTDGDPTLTDTLRGWLWADYQAAGAPYGPTEDGLYLWCDEPGGPLSGLAA